MKLVPEDAIAVEVFDEHGIAESNALVAPSLWIRNPLVNPHRTMHCKIDANGNASLLGSKKQELLNNNGIPRMVRGYFYEMACVIAECARVLKRGAPLMMVNDNVRYAGASVSVDIILSEIAVDRS